MNHSDAACERVKEHVAVQYMSEESRVIGGVWDVECLPHCGCCIMLDEHET